VLTNDGYLAERKAVHGVLKEIRLSEFQSINTRIGNMQHRGEQYDAQIMGV
jgi:hypothetical protein